MTNIQAIDLLKGLEQSLDDYCELNDEGKTAFRMAITALEVFGISEQLPSAQPDVLDTNVGDMIGRQAAIDLLKQMRKDGDMVPWEGKDVFARIRKLPSAQPKRKKGQWIDKSNGIEGAWNYCSVCGEQAIDLYDFCPNCGADMRGNEDGAD